MLEQLTTIPQSFYQQEQKRLSFLAYLFLFLVCVAFFTPGIVTIPATDRDESSFAQASKQMIESGNYTDIRLKDEPRYKKPIGIYWLQSTSVRLFNPHYLDEIWAYRIPSFLGATISVLMTAALGTLLFGPMVGLLAALMLAGSVLLNVEARLAKTDAALLASIMVSLYALAKAYIENKEQQLAIEYTKSLKNSISPYVNPFVFWTALSCGILIKGPIILMPLIGVLLWLRISDKNLKWFKSLRPVLGFIYALVLISPWFIAISMQSHGVFIEQSAGHDMFAKIWQGQNRGVMPPGMYLMALPLTFFPFVLFILFAAPDAWKNRKDTSVKFCLGWIIPTWVIFELSFTKLPHYVLPTYPALSLLTAKFLSDGFPTLAVTTRRLPIALVIGFWIILGMGFAILFSLLPILVDGTWQPPQMFAGIFLILSQGATLLLMPKHKTTSVIALTIGSLIFLSITFGSTLPQLQHIWMSREIVTAVEPLKPCPDSQIVSVGYHEPSLVFMAGTQTILAMNGLEAADDLKRNSCDVVVINGDQKDEFVGAFSGAAYQPRPLATINGLNSGHGSQVDMFIYAITK
jgi:4-amino-4-deoxy-L-arabinose transferase-like glycosyltransferase